MPTYNKLVRDRTPEIIEKNGKNSRIIILDEQTFEEELRVKLREELNELLGAKSFEEKKEEMADLLEVMYAYGLHIGVTPGEIESVRERKRAERGGFEKRILLVDVDE